MPFGVAGIGRNIGEHDVIGNLREAGLEAAARRLADLRLRRDDAHGAMRVVLDQIGELRESKLDLERQLRLLQDRYRDNRGRAFGGPAVYEEDEATAKLDAVARAHAKLTWIAPDDPPGIAELKTKINHCFQEMQRLAPADKVRATTSNLRGNLVRNVEGWLASEIPPGCVLRALPETTPALRKGANILDEIEARQRRHREFTADLHAVRTAPILATAAKQRARAKIEALAARGEPNIGGLLFGGELEMPMLPMRTTPVINDARVLVAWEAFDAEAFGIWAFKDIVLKKLDALIDAEPNEGALTDEARAAREREILRDTSAVEVEECRLIEQAHALGMTSIEFREDASALAILNLTMETASPGVMSRLLAAVTGG